MWFNSDKNRASSTIVGTSNNDNTGIKDTQEQVDKLEKLVSTLSESIKKLSSSSNAPKAIKFGGLGFTSLQDVATWLQLNDPSEDFGWVIDFPIMCEHIINQMKEEDIVKRIERG